MKIKNQFLVAAVLFLTSCQSLQGQAPVYTKRQPAADEIAGEYVLKSVSMPSAGTDLSNELKGLPTRPTILIGADGHARLIQIPLFFSRGTGGSYRFEGFRDFEVTWRTAQAGNVFNDAGGVEAIFGLRFEGLPWVLSGPVFTGETVDGLIFYFGESKDDSIIYSKK